MDHTLALCLQGHGVDLEQRNYTGAPQRLVLFPPTRILPDGSAAADGTGKNTCVVGFLLVALVIVQMPLQSLIETHFERVLDYRKDKWVCGDADDWTGGTRSINRTHVSYNCNITATTHVHPSHHPPRLIITPFDSQHGNSFSTLHPQTRPPPLPGRSFANFPYQVIRPRSSCPTVSGTLPCVGSPLLGSQFPCLRVGSTADVPCRWPDIRRRLSDREAMPCFVGHATVATRGGFHVCCTNRALLSCDTT